MVFIFTALSFLCFNFCSSLHAMQNDEADEFVEIEGGYNPAYMVSAIITKAVPVIKTASAAADYTSRQISSGMRKASPRAYVSDESNIALYRETIDVLQQDNAAFSAADHNVTKCLNRYWYCSQALIDAFRTQDVKALEENISSNNLVLANDLNNAIIRSLEKAKVDRLLNPECVPAHSSNWLKPLSGVVNVYNVLDDEKRVNFQKTIEDLANKKHSEFIQDQQCMQYLKEAQQLQYEIAKQLVAQAKLLDKNKEQAESISLCDKATQISRRHHPTLSPVFKAVARWAVHEEQRVLDIKSKNAIEAKGLFSIVWY